MIENVLLYRSDFRDMWDAGETIVGRWRGVAADIAHAAQIPVAEAEDWLNILHLSCDNLFFASRDFCREVVSEIADVLIVGKAKELELAEGERQSIRDEASHIRWYCDTATGQTDAGGVEQTLAMICLAKSVSRQAAEAAIAHFPNATDDTLADDTARQAMVAAASMFLHTDHQWAMQ